MSLISMKLSEYDLAVKMLASDASAIPMALDCNNGGSNSPTISEAQACAEELLSIMNMYQALLQSDIKNLRAAQHTLDQTDREEAIAFS